VLVATFDLSPQGQRDQQQLRAKLRRFLGGRLRGEQLPVGSAIDIRARRGASRWNRIRASGHHERELGDVHVASPNSFTVTGDRVARRRRSRSPACRRASPSRPRPASSAARRRLGTGGHYTLTITASNAGGTDTRFFTLTVIKANQAITSMRRRTRTSARADRAGRRDQLRPRVAFASRRRRSARSGDHGSRWVAAGTCTVQGEPGGRCGLQPGTDSPRRASPSFATAAGCASDHGGRTGRQRAPSFPSRRLRLRRLAGSLRTRRRATREA